MARFNSRPRVAGDRFLDPLHPPRSVSIHARAWRATWSPGGRTSRGRFNSRPRVAGDILGLAVRAEGIVFQFTPARGGRPFAETMRSPLSGFNSRPRVAGDRISSDDVLAVLFQFTPARGGRQCPRPIGRRWKYVSIHARAWRATRYQSYTSLEREFQFTPARGGRPKELLEVWTRGVSIHARAWRATVVDRKISVFGAVSIHARAWRATAVLAL